MVQLPLYVFFSHGLSRWIAKLWSCKPSVMCGKFTYPKALDWWLSSLKMKELLPFLSNVPQAHVAVFPVSWLPGCLARTGWATPARRAPPLSTTSWWGWAKWVGFLNEGIFFYQLCSTKTCLCFFFSTGNLIYCKTFQNSKRHHVTNGSDLGCTPFPGWESLWYRYSHRVTVGLPRLIWMLRSCFGEDIFPSLGQGWW